jgi:glycosyltransferase involved in cell wall biosynthesis
MKRMAPLITIVIPSFNRKAKLCRAVASVLSQDFEDFEIIVVDDASTDGTRAALARISDPRLRVLCHEKNEGGGAARNTGIRAAAGDFVAFLDSDDEWLPDKLTRNLACVRERQLCGLWVLFNSVLIVEPDCERVSRGGALRPREAIAEYLFVRRGYVQTSALFMPVGLAKRVEFDAGLKRLQDWDFYLRAESEGATFHYQDEVLTRYHADAAADRISNTLAPEFLEQWIQARRHSISARAYVGFRANKIAPEAIAGGKRWAGAVHLCHGILRGAVPLKFAILELIRLCTPRTAFNHLLRVRGYVRRTTPAPANVGSE